jgi:hypothetical protein
MFSVSQKVQNLSIFGMAERRSSGLSYALSREKMHSMLWLKGVNPELWQDPWHVTKHMAQAYKML